MSRVIVTHVSRSMDEIAAIVAGSGAFTAPLGLPHYRYDRTRLNLRLLVKYGLLARNGVNDIHHHFKAGPRMAAWIDAGKPPVKAYVKPPKPSPWENFKW